MTTWHIVGDIHGHLGQFRALLITLGYTRPDPIGDPYRWKAPADAQLVSVGDVVDRGLDSLGCLRILMRMVETGDARMVLGNHEIRYRELIAELLGEAQGGRSRPASRLVSHLQLLALPHDELRRIADWLDRRPCYLELDDGSIVVHAAWDRGIAHRSRAEQLTAFALGRLPADTSDSEAPRLPANGAGFYRVPDAQPIAGDLAWTRKCRRTVFWGHRILSLGAVVAIGKTINVESGCCYGKALSAYVHPSGALVQTTGTGRHSRWLFRPLRALEGVLFPPGLDFVRAVLERERLHTADDYIAWLEMQAEDAGAELPPSIADAHRGLFDRVRDPEAGTAD